MYRCIYVGVNASNVVLAGGKEAEEAYIYICTYMHKCTDVRVRVSPRRQHCRVGGCPYNVVDAGGKEAEEADKAYR